MKHWKASVEESCDVDFLCCMIMHHAHTAGVVMSAVTECSYESWTILATPS